MSFAFTNTHSNQVDLGAQREILLQKYQETPSKFHKAVMLW